MSLTIKYKVGIVGIFCVALAAQPIASARVLPPIQIDTNKLSVMSDELMSSNMGIELAHSYSTEPARQTTPSGWGELLAIEAGMTHTCVLTGNGATYCWGDNKSGQLGDGTMINRLSPVLVSGLTSGVTAISAGINFTCAIVNGAAKCWGANNSGQLGDGTSVTRTTPVNVVGLPNTVTSIATDYTGCAIVDGAVWCWDKYSDYKPSLQPFGNNNIRMGASVGHRCVIRSVGSLLCWGLNTHGELGDGTTTDRFESPVQVSGMNSGVTQVDLAIDSSCAVVNGAAKCWGRNNYGQLGDGTNQQRLVPTLVTGLGSGVSKISINSYSACAVVNGAAKCWGGNTFGQLGTGDTKASLAPVDLKGLSNGVIDISVGLLHACAIVSSGDVFCWGANDWGNLGDGTTASKLSPVKVLAPIINQPTSTPTAPPPAPPTATPTNPSVPTTPTVTSTPTNTRVPPTVTLTPTNTPVGSKNAAKSIATGGKQTCAVTDFGNVLCWGLGGQTGDGTSTLRSSPVQVVGLTRDVRSVSSGLNHTCAVLNNGSVRCWGRNEFGQVGNANAENAVMPVLAPEQVIGISRVVQLAAGSNHVCALTADGTVKCWGQNDNAAAGGPFNPQLTPYDIVGLDKGITQISSGEQYACALTNAGVIKCWGLIEGIDQGWGGVKRTPVEVPLGSKAKAVAAGYKHACAILENDKVTCWGSNAYGETGIGQVTGANNPMPVVGLQNVTAIAAGKYVSCAILQDGSVSCWGLNANGQLGNGNFTDSAIPVSVKGLAGPVAAIDVGKAAEYDASGPRWYGGQVCAILKDGRMMCWGNSTYGQLGNGSVLQSQLSPVMVKGLDIARDPVLAPTPTPTPIPLIVKIHLEALFMNHFVAEPETQPTVDPTPTPIGEVLPTPTPTQGPTATATPPSDCCEVNDDFNTAALMQENTTVVATLRYETDSVDFYKIALVRNIRYSFNLTHQGIADLDLYLYDYESGNKLLVKSTQVGVQNESFTYTPNETRTYYVVVSNVTPNSFTSYALSIGH